MSEAGRAEVPREMTHREREIVSKIVLPTTVGRDEILRLLDAARVRRVDENGSLEFLFDDGVGYVETDYRIPAEGEFIDSDGTPAHVLLYVTPHGRLTYLEFFREDAGALRSPPVAEAIGACELHEEP